MSRYPLVSVPASISNVLKPARASRHATGPPPAPDPTSHMSAFRPKCSVVGFFLTNDVVIYALLVRIGNVFSLLFGLVTVLMLVAIFTLVLLRWNCQRRDQECKVEEPVNAHDGYSKFETLGNGIR